MTSDIDIFRSANLLVKHHGEDAPIEAAVRADSLLEAGEMNGESFRLKQSKTTNKA